MYFCHEEKTAGFLSPNGVGWSQPVEYGGKHTSHLKDMATVMVGMLAVPPSSSHRERIFSAASKNCSVHHWRQEVGRS